MFLWRIRYLACLLIRRRIEVSFGTSFPINFPSTFRVHEGEPAFFTPPNPRWDLPRCSETPQPECWSCGAWKIFNSSRGCLENTRHEWTSLDISLKSFDKGIQWGERSCSAAQFNAAAKYKCCGVAVLQLGGGRSNSTTW
jgi:hypothetical protein